MRIEVKVSVCMCWLSVDIHFSRVPLLVVIVSKKGSPCSVLSSTVNCMLGFMEFRL